MKKILLSAFACDPYKGSELAYGWNWATGLAKEGYEVHCLTRNKHRLSIEEYGHCENVHFHYISLPGSMESLFLYSQPTMYVYYLFWQMLALKEARKLHRHFRFDLVHHVTWGSVQLGSFLYKLKIPFIFGPAGGGQKAPESLKKYFLSHWSSEVKRERVSEFLFRYNPGCFNMLKNASVILVSNPDTLSFVNRIRSKDVYLTLDTAISKSFFPETLVQEERQFETLKLLWVGRFMPRKGVMLLLEVMRELKSFPGITLTLVGDGEMRESIDEFIVKNDLSQTVQLTGMVPFKEVTWYYHTHDAFIFTSLRDSGGVQLIEAMAYGLPIIALNLHGQAIIVNDSTGFRCSCDSPEVAIKELKSAVVALYSNRQLLNSMSEEAQSFAKKHTWENKIKDFIKDYYPS